MFDSHFEVFLADTEESKKIHYKIRYQVYCEEMGFENKEDFPDEMEYDADDEKSIHFIVRNKETTDWVGAMRLIYKGDGLLPVEQSCNLNEKVNNDLFETVEISRLCLLKHVRKGKDIDPPHGIYKDPKQNKLNRLIIWGMFHAAVEYGNENKIPNSYFMTTMALAKLLKRAGLNLINIGGSCQHKGERFPFRMNTKEAYQSQVWTHGYNQGYQLFSGLTKVSQAA